jgi:putative hydrolase of the HAD superfamily
MSEWHHLRLITIDLDDTLWPCAPAIREAEVAHHAWLVEHAPRVTAQHDVVSLREHRRELMRARPEIAHDVTALRRASLRALLVEHAYPESLAEGAMDAFRKARNRVQPYADAVPVLGRLSRHCPLVSLTNGNAEVHETPLSGLFARCLTAAEAGAAKPAPAMFELAMDWAAATPGESLHVGDDPFLDVEAARVLGCAAVWVNRDGRQWPAELAPPLLEVRDLHALEAWLALPGADG